MWKSTAIFNVYGYSIPLDFSSGNLISMKSLFNIHRYGCTLMYGKNMHAFSHQILCGVVLFMIILSMNILLDGVFPNFIKLPTRIYLVSICGCIIARASQWPVLPIIARIGLRTGAWFGQALLIIGLILPMVYHFPCPIPIKVLNI